MITAAPFYMIRHGETEANAAKTMAGSIDTPLTPKGRAQAADAKTVLMNLKQSPVAVVHSPLSRARHTAEIINEDLGLPMFEDPDLRELHAGEWEGVPYADCNPILAGWNDPPGGERVADFSARVRRGISRAIERHREEGPPIIVCHGGVFRAFWKMYGADTLGVENAKIYEFVPCEVTSSWKAWHYHYQDEMVRTAVQHD